MAEGQGDVLPFGKVMVGDVLKQICKECIVESGPVWMCGLLRGRFLG